MQSPRLRRRSTSPHHACRVDDFQLYHGRVTRNRGGVAHAEDGRPTPRCSPRAAALLHATTRRHGILLGRIRNNRGQSAIPRRKQPSPDARRNRDALPLDRRAWRRAHHRGRSRWSGYGGMDPGDLPEVNGPRPGIGRGPSTTARPPTPASGAKGRRAMAWLRCRNAPATASPRNAAAHP